MLAVQVYLSCQILNALGTVQDCSPEALSAAAKCYECLDDHTLKAITAVNLCAIVNAI